MSMLTPQAPEGYATTRRAFLSRIPFAALFAFARPTTAKPQPATPRGPSPARLAEMIHNAEETARCHLRWYRPSCLAELEAELVAFEMNRGNLEFAICCPGEPALLAREGGPLTATCFLPEGMEPSWKVRTVLGFICLMAETEPPQLCDTISHFDAAAAQARLKPVSDAYLAVLEAAL
jgi:hypothetical protein